MGINCSCFREYNLDEAQKTKDFSQIIDRPKSDKLSKTQIIVLQNLIRGFIDRYEYKGNRKIINGQTDDFFIPLEPDMPDIPQLKMKLQDLEEKLIWSGIEQQLKDIEENSDDEASIDQINSKDTYKVPKKKMRQNSSEEVEEIDEEELNESIDKCDESHKDKIEWRDKSASSLQELSIKDEEPFLTEEQNEQKEPSPIHKSEKDYEGTDLMQNNSVSIIQVEQNFDVQKIDPTFSAHEVMLKNDEGVLESEKFMDLDNIDSFIKEPGVPIMEEPFCLTQEMKNKEELQQTQEVPDPYLQLNSPNCSTSRYVQINESQIPDYSTIKTRKALRKLEPFQSNLEPVDSTPIQRRGPIQFQDKSIYVGQWNAKEQRHGNGTYMQPDGLTYEGQWISDLKHGKGRLVYNEGNVYEGDFVNDEPQGNCVFYHMNGSVYKGYWKNNDKHGYGIQTYIDNSCYTGNFVYGTKQGSGQLAQADGSFYNGQFANGKIEGYGVFEWANGRKYQGYWKDNKMNGHGILTQKDGRIYEGELLDQNKHGYGVYSWPNGRKHEGYWENGKQHGEGVATTIRGDRIEGIWKDGHRVEEQQNNILFKIVCIFENSIQDPQYSIKFIEVQNQISSNY